MTTENDILFISLESWDDIWRRNQFVCAELARRHPGSRILFVTPPRDLSNALRRRHFGKLRPEAAWSPPGLPNVHVFKPTKWLPNTLELGRKLNVAHLRRQLRSAMYQLGVHDPLLWINDHSAAELVGTLGERGVVYDVTDDWISFEPPGFLKERIRRQDASLCERADAVIVCSERLAEMKRPDVRHLYMIANGVDAEHYRAVLDGQGPLPTAAASWQRPVYGYTGSVHGERVDVALVREIAKRLDGTVVLVGPDMLTPAERAQLADAPNVVLFGPVAYRDVPQYMRAFDVCITPHRVTPFTESLNPIKLWEYLAAGKPIVSTPVAGFRDYPDWVRTGTGPEAFCSAVREALSEPASFGARRRAAAGEHSWVRRVDQIEQVFADVAARRAAPSQVAVS